MLKVVIGPDQGDSTRLSLDNFEVPAHYPPAPHECPFTFPNCSLIILGPKWTVSLPYLLGGSILLDISHLGRICKQSLDKVKKAYQTSHGGFYSQLTQKLPCHYKTTHIWAFVSF